MGRNAELFVDHEAYAKLGEFPEDYPFGKYEPLDPAFTRKGSVISGGKHQRKYRVDLSIGECQCQKGWAWGWNQDKGTWYRAGYCAHKLRMMANIIDEMRGGDDKAALRSAERAYLKALGTRYNPFEAVSAFHKELRRGDFEAAWFWGLVLGTKRGLRGVFMYMLNIIYEETRDHDLADHLLDVLADQRMITLASLSRCIGWFCATPKKWELPHRMQIFVAEMEGYNELAKKYSPEVAKPWNIIPADQKKHLLASMKNGFKSRNLKLIQYGLKGLQKLECSAKKSEDDLQDHRYWLYEQLYEIAEQLLPDEHPAWGVINVVNKRIAASRGIGYHDLNAIADAIAGEPYETGILPPKRRKLVTARPTPAIPLGKWPQIPLYAHDNHTWGGKALMRRFGDQLAPGARQTDLDFRYCGAYFGVCYRMLSFDQHREVAEWHKVKWVPSLHKIVSMLWY